jgi:pimeloyl-ACP methyl ester carboxylesterase
MKVLSFVFVFVATASFAFSAQNQTGLVEINKKQLYVEYTKPVGNKPTIVFVNGLTYSTKNWVGVSEPLINKGYGVVLYDMQGMGTTLLSNPLPDGSILYSTQASDLHTLLAGLKIPKPYNLVGLSYGGGILAAYTTRYPEDIGNLVMMNPYTEFLSTQRDMIKQEIKTTRAMFPLNPASDEQLTDYFIRQMVYTTYPAAEPSTLANPFILEGVTRLVQGIRMYQPIEDALKIPAHKLHLVISEQDQYIPQDVYARYWNAVPAKSRLSLTYVKYSEHKLPEAYPKFTAQFIQGVVDGQPLLFNGDVLEADPNTMKIEKKR